MSKASEDRSYIAFISYRHLQPDKQAAEIIQKKIENYTVPKEFRDKTGGKKLGHVFRDEDELQASASLTDSIYYALDHSEFLIVICTPNLPASPWCEAEIRYFLKNHDRDHVLAVLADGEPDESFSKLLLHDYDEEGNIISETEPLAANISGPDHTISKKLLNKELTRIYSALIGCPFDALWQRERRAKTNRLLGTAAAAVVVLVVFLGVVMNRNAQIEEQNRMIQEQNDRITSQNDRITEQNDELSEKNDKIEEQNAELLSRLSTVYVDSGISKLEDHDVYGALEDALTALQNEDQGIYDRRAEKLLSDALGAYKTGEAQSRLVYEQSTDIVELWNTKDEKHLLLLDTVGVLRCLDLETYSKEWEHLVNDTHSVVYSGPSDDTILVKDYSGLSCLSVADGSVLWTYPQDSPNYFQCISDDASVFAVLDTESEDTGSFYNTDDPKAFRPVYAVFIDTLTGSELGRAELACEFYGIEDLSDDAFKPRHFGSDFSSNNRYFMCSMYFQVMSDEAPYPFCEPVFIIDLDDFTAEIAGRLQDPTRESFYLSDIYFGCDITDDGNSVIMTQYTTNSQDMDVLSAERNGDDFDRNIVHESLVFSYDLLQEDGNNSIERYTPPALFSDEQIIIFADNSVSIFDRETLYLKKTYELDSGIVSAYWNDKEKNTIDIFTAGGMIYNWILSSADETVLEYNASRHSDQKDIFRSIPISGGVVRNADSGKYLSVSSEHKGCLYELAFHSDPSCDVIFTGWSDYKLYNNAAGNVDIYGDTGLIYVDFSDADDFSAAVKFERESGELQEYVATDDEFDNYPFFLMNETSFIQGGSIYDLSDGSSKALSAPQEGSFSVPVGFISSVRLNDGRILSSDLCYSTDSEQQLQLTSYPLWIDGEFRDVAFHIEDPDIYTSGEWINGLIPKLGRAGMIMIYGKESTGGDDAKDMYHVMTVSDGARYHFEDAYPEEEPVLTAMGNATYQMAVLYRSGRLCVYDIKTGDHRIIASEDDERFRGQNETTALCFSDDDRFIVSVNTAGDVNIADLQSEEVHSFSSQLLSHSEGTDQAVRRLGGFLDYLNVRTGSDGHKLYIFFGMENWYSTIAVVDSESWTVTHNIEEGIFLDNTYDYLYCFTFNYDGQGSGAVVRYPVHTLDDLKKWAEKELEKV